MDINVLGVVSNKVLRKFISELSCILIRRGKGVPDKGLVVGVHVVLSHVHSGLVVLAHVDESLDNLLVAAGFLVDSCSLLELVVLLEEISKLSGPG